jgi:hypothetical protein
MVVKMADGSLKTVQELLADGVGSSGGSAVSSSTFSRIEKSSETHCDIGGPWGWREEKSFCVVEGSVRLQGKCPSGTNKYGALGCYYLGCGDECCFYMCGVIRE